MSAAGARPCSPAAGRAARGSLPSPVPSCGPSVEEERDVGAERRGELVQRSAGAARSSVSFASRSAVAASELPPPRPAATGIRFSIRARQRGSTPAAAGERLERARTSVSPAKPVDAQGRRRLELDPVGEVDPLEDGRDLVLAVVARVGPTTSARLIFAGAAAPHRRALGERDELGRRERLGAHGRVAADRLERRRRLLARRDAGERERVRERLAAVRERRLDEPLDAGGSRARCGGRRRAPSRRSAAAGRPRARPGGSRCARSRAGRAPRRRRTPSSRRGEEAVGDLALHHHAPALDGGQPVEALDDDRRRDVVRQVRDELARRGLERREVERERVAPVQLGVREASQLGLERPVDLDGVDVGDPLGEEAREDAEARADLEHDVVRARASASRSITPRMFSSTRKCWPSLLLRDDGHSPKAAVAFASICAASSAASSPRASASAASVWTTYAGSFGRPRTGCGARYGLSVSARIRSRRHVARRVAQLGRVRVGDVAGERDVPAALERRTGAAPARRSSGGRRCRRSPRAPRACRSSAARVWITTGLPSSAASSSSASKRPRCRSRGA